ncbi:MAG: signal recognition particle protein [Bacteroidales bacterium]|nr:signal recognition particle protein [Bacteroidales bacterium]MDE7101280.1 signal recognition particle protein [Bacteroidales bacterium]
MFENLSDKLDRAFKLLKGQGRITEINVAETLKEVRRALLDADVSYKIAKQFTDTVKEKAMGQNVLTAVSPGQMMVKLVHDELVSLMGTSAAELNLQINPTVILMAGLQGSGKTTHSAKLANFLKSKKGKHPLLVAADVYRPAAIDQLETLGTQIDVPVFSQREEKDPVKIARAAVRHAKENALNVVIIDTAGRLAVDEDMMDEIGRIKAEVNPQETLFVVDAMTGQDAVNTAKAFYDRLQYEGVILTKLDGDTRGGAALTIRSVVQVPIKFVGVGEKMDALDIFYPARMADRILGMGDIVSFVERAQAQYDEEEARKLQKKFRTNDFNFDDFYAQIQQIKKMGNMKDLLGMIPGVGKALKDVEVDDNAFKSIEAMIQSMTPYERTHPQVLDAGRRKRIADGSGTSIQEVNKMIKQLEETKKMMRTVSKPGMMQAMKQMRHGRR